MRFRRALLRHKRHPPARLPEGTREVVFLTLLAAWLIVPLLTAVALSLHLSSAPLIPATPLSVPLQHHSEFLEPAEIIIDWTQEQPVVAPAWAGIVQELLIAPGAEVTEGTPVVRLNGIIRTIGLTQFPLAQPLAIGDSGAEVQQLHDLLSARGLSEQGGDTFTAATLAGVRQLAAAVAVPHPERVLAFDPSWIIFSPRAGLVDSISAAVGMGAPALGEPLLTLASEAISATLRIPPGNAQPEPGIGHQELPTETDMAHGPTGGQRVLAHGEELLVGGVPLGLPVGEAAFPAEVLTQLVGIVGRGSPALPAVIKHPLLADQWIIPAAAFTPLSPTEGCVITGKHPPGTPHRVEILHASAREFIVSGALRAQQGLLIFPPEVLTPCE